MLTQPEDKLTAAARPGLSTLAAVLALLALIVWRYGPVLQSLETSFVDFSALHGSQLVAEGADSRLNAWILDWVQHAALYSPSTILDANAFYPARGTLTGSEHLFGIALQTLPFRPLFPSAIAIHQLALLLSALGLAATSFIAVRALTASNAAGLVAGVAAVMMPWRTTEISHLQLSSVQWFPAIWILLIRAVHRDVRMGERILLGVCVALQLLSSFYLAYFLTLSSGLLLLLIGLRDSARRRRLPAIAATLAPAYVVFGLSALPYWTRRAATDLAPGYDPTFSVGLASVWQLIQPRVPAWLQSSSPTVLSPEAFYDIPAGVLVLALGAAIAVARRAEFSTELRSAVLGLWAVAVLGFIFMLGGSLQWGTWHIPLPSQLLVAVLPGFEMLRGPVRWAILMGIAMPLLAGIGIGMLRRRPGSVSRTVATVVAVLGLGASLEWFSIPVLPAWEKPASIQRRYGALQALPPGPIVEVPFSNRLDGLPGARAMLASTLHRRPLVNGYTGYAPRSHALLKRLGMRLPEREILAHFGWLTGARYFVIDLRELRPGEIPGWNRLEREGLITRRFADGFSRIYELRATAANGSGIPALLAASPGPTTAAGLSRAPLVLAAGTGSLKVRAPPRQFAGIDNAVRVTVRNDSPVGWPGLDLYREGLVLVRYTWREAGSEAPLQTRVHPLDHDLAPGQSFHSQLWLSAPLREGAHELCLDLVQQQASKLVKLPMTASLHHIKLIRPAGLTGLNELIAAATLEAHALAPCTPPDMKSDRKASQVRMESIVQGT